jgi:hypothetical protein
MKRSTMNLLAACTGALLLMGCAPDPGDVCAKMEKVFQVNPTEAPAFLKSRNDCVASFESKKSRRGVNSYRREAECILASSKPYEITQCMEKEAKFRD